MTHFPLAACAEMLWRDKPIEWRAIRLKEMGLGVGLWNWPAHDLAALEKTGATFTIMNGYLEGRLLPTQVADCPRDDEGPHGLDQAARQHFDGMVDLVLQRQDIFIVVHDADMLIPGIEEDLLRTEVVRWRIETDDEVAREQILLQRFVIGIRVDEDVGEGRGSVALVPTYFWCFRLVRSQEDQLRSWAMISFMVGWQCCRVSRHPINGANRIFLSGLSCF